jgi:hypothetical protein
MKNIQVFGTQLRWFKSRYRLISLCSSVRSSQSNYVGSSPSIGIFLYVDLSGLRKRTTLVRVPLSSFFYICSPVKSSETKYVFSSSANWHISLCSPVRSSETNYVCSSPTIGILLYVAQSGLRKRTTLVRVSLSSFYYM